MSEQISPLEEVAVSDRFHKNGNLPTFSDVWHRQRDFGAPGTGGADASDCL